MLDQPLHEPAQGFDSENLPDFCGLKAYNHEAEKHFNENYESNRRSIADYCGPPHLWARRGAAILYASMLFQYIWSVHKYRRTSCDDKSINDVFAKVVSVVVVVALASIEFHCMRYVILPWQGLANGFPMFGFKVPYFVWLIYAQGLSAVSQVTLQANAHLAGFMTACKKGPATKKWTDEDWTEAIKCMICMVFLWAATFLLFLQPLMAGFYNWPLWEDTKPEEIIEPERRWAFGRPPDDQDNTMPSKWEVRFSTWAKKLGLRDWKATHFEALIDWSRSSFMNSLTSLNVSFNAAQMDSALNKIENEPKHVKNYLHSFELMCEKACAFMFCVGVLKTGMQTMTQVYMYNLLHYDTPDRLCLLLLNFFSAFGMEATKMIDVAGAARKVLYTHKQKVRHGLANFPNSDHDWADREKFLRSAKRKFWGFMCMCFVSVLMLAISFDWLVF